MQTKHFLGRWLSYALWALIVGAVLYLFGMWCLRSTDIPPPPMSLPLPRRFLIGLGLILWQPFTLVPLTLIIIGSRFLGSKLNRARSAAVTLVGFAFVLVGAFWVPNPIVLWPFSMMSDHERMLPEMIGQLFTFHVVPSPGLSYGTSAGFRGLIRWQIEECGARFCILIIAWIACLVAISIIDRRIRKTTSLQPATAATGN
jgi:hypothetical protein